MDFLKIIAIYMILFNHTGTKGFVLFTVKQDSPLFFFYLFNTIFIKVAVQLFFMTSGALLLDKEESLKRVVVNRFMKYLLVLIVCSLLQYAYACYNSDSQVFTLSTFFIRLYTRQLSNAYWYLYAYLAYILMLPFLRRLAKSMNEKEYLWMIFLYGFINVLSIIEYVIWKGEYTHNSHFNFFISSIYVFYPLLGYYLDRVMSEKFNSWKTIVVLSLLSIVSIVICCLMTILKCETIGEWTEATCQTFFCTLIFIPSAAVYLGAKMWFQRFEPKERTSKVISTLGGLTFGIFLIENICRKETQQIFYVLEPYINTLPACWIWILAACLFGAAVTYLLKLIPGVKNYI